MRACFRICSGLACTPFTFGANFPFFYLNSGFKSKSSFQEAKLDVITEIGAALGHRTGSSSRSESAKSFENIPETRKNFIKSQKTGKSGPFEPLMPKLVINPPFVRIH